ncbi:MAG: adenylate/guanylate cyclase domain-containing protein [Treponema sp.]|jgi:adenylate cyclase|nr:adenylate/guanylate cyclase domain-containing protein [Treponema sp.]
MKNWKNALLGLAAAAVFTILYLVGALTVLEQQLYDFFLRFRADREQLEDVVFLNVDDNAIAYYGIFPWPRSIYGDGLLRLKEFGSRAVIFDIEFIERGHQGIDIHYMNYRLERDFSGSFSEIKTATQEILSAIQAGQIRQNDISHFSGTLSSIITEEERSLFNNVLNVARDNDLYFSQAIALNGNTWTTVQMSFSHLAGEQAERRSIAEEHFAVPVNAAGNFVLGYNFVDVLPALPIFSQSAKGAGFTNAVVDSDSVRRRVYLVQNAYDHWYPQLAFAPLHSFLGSPQIIFEKRKLTLKQAQMPDGQVRDLSIPLDNYGRLMLDWHKENYFDKYTHVSFATFAVLDEIEADLEYYSSALLSAEWMDFTQFDPSLRVIPRTLIEIGELFDAARTVRSFAMENTCDNSFNAYLEYRNYAMELLGDIFAMNVEEKLQEIIMLLFDEYPDYIDLFEEEAEYILLLIDRLKSDLNQYHELIENYASVFSDKFVIIGRVDTGTTDFGVNPFHGNYINVGTHGVVLDTILSESFIIPLGLLWSILLIFIFVPPFFFFSSGLPPVIRASSGFGAVFFIFAGTVLLFRFSGVFLSPVGVVLATVSATIIREIILYAASEKEKRFIRNAFSTYVSSDIVKEIIADPSRLQLGGTEHYMTAVFTDVKGFSTISEKLGDPAKLVSLLNKYLSAMSDVVLAEKGTIDKYIGDAIVAFFGAPIQLEDHALRACVSAIAMKKIEVDMNKEIMEQNLSPIPLLTRIGVNTGSMVAGNMGTANKMNYTIMGNAVNLAARLEGVNNQYGTWVLASEDTVLETKDALLYRKLDRVRVVGINKPVRLCELIDMADIASEQDRKLVSVFHEALDNFEKRQWKQAIEGFNEALIIKPNDTPSTIYLDRLKQFSVTMPDDSWDGVYNLTSK